MADVLFGKVNPSKKQPVMIPCYAGRLPAYYNHQNSENKYLFLDLSFRDINRNVLNESVYGAEVYM